jgi:hypothetical protein
MGRFLLGIVQGTGGSLGQATIIFEEMEKPNGQ